MKLLVTSVSHWQSAEIKKEKSCFTPCSRILSVSHLSSLRYSRREASAARSITKANGVPFSSIDKAWRKKIRRLLVKTQGYPLSFPLILQQVAQSCQIDIVLAAPCKYTSALSKPLWIYLLRKFIFEHSNCYHKPTSTSNWCPCT